ncbi:MAG TPA: hypothetical protein VF042_08290 [Gemmatimonadaceae bacterium]
MRTVTDSGLILRNVVITRDSLTGYVSDDSLYAVALRDVRLVEVQKINGKQVLNYALVLLGAAALVWAFLIYTIIAGEGT